MIAATTKDAGPEAALRVFSSDTQLTANLDIRTCIWWGTLCAWDVVRDADAAAEKPAFDLIVHWYQHGMDDIRRQAGLLADSKRFSTAISVLLKAIYMTGSLSPADCPAVHCDPNIVRRMVGASLDTMLSKIAAPVRAAQSVRFEHILHDLLAS